MPSIASSSTLRFSFQIVIVWSALSLTSQGRSVFAAGEKTESDLGSPSVAGPQAPQAILFSSDDVFPRERWIYDQGPVPKATGAVAALIEAKRQETGRKYDACAGTAARARTSAKSLAPWINLLELRCANAAATDGARNGSTLARALEEVDRHREMLLDGPHAPALRQAYAQASLALLEHDVKGERGRAWRSFDRFERARAWCDDKQRARGFRAAGELAFIQQRLEASRALLRRSLEAQPDQPEVRARLQALETTLLKPNREVPPIAGPLEPAGTVGDARLESTGRENELVERATLALKRGDLVPAADDLATLLKDFPGGARAKWASDRMLESYLSIAEREDHKQNGARQQVQKRMLECDADRRTEWARAICAKGFFDDCLRLAKSAADSSKGSAREGKALEAGLAGAMASERWSDVREMAQGLIDRHAGTPAGREALFRNAQASYRLKDFGAAVASLERLLAMPQSETFELNARHLLWRALQKIGSPRANESRDIILTKYPFSYYGLRARLDRDGGLDSLESVLPGADTKSSSKTKIVEEEWMSGSSRTGYERAILLLKAGWIEEAQAEIRDLPPPVGPRAKALRGRLHAAALDYVVASKLVSDAWDADSSLRREPFLRVGFPLEFLPSVEKEAKARSLEKWLVLGLIKQESAFNVRAQSTSNAYGLMQMIPPTAREIAEDLGVRGLEVPRDLYGPPLNVRMGTWYLSKMVRKHQGHVPLALASYNAGPGRIDRWLRSRPSLAGLASLRSSQPDDELWFDEMPWAETCFYVKAILRNLILYRWLDRDLDQRRVEVSGMQTPIWIQPSSGANP